MPDAAAVETGHREQGRILVFMVDGQEYGVSLQPIVEIVRHRGATPVPFADKAIEGIVPLRGRMVTLFDLRRCLARPPRPPDRRAQVVVVESSGDLLGLVVDSVSRVTAVPGDALEPLPSGLRHGPPGVLGGVLRHKEGYVILLELDAMVKRLS
ncbi:MAG TPA: chemotaxis protein CheW [Candidatus Polarisedimenticolia bacterium]|nr:chemotaxis protein CheW [Candidatus Polarisedimenticolia bacterium]